VSHWTRLARPNHFLMMENPNSKTHVLKRKQEYLIIRFFVYDARPSSVASGWRVAGGGDAPERQGAGLHFSGTEISTM
jgi:hypothetical protein